MARTSSAAATRKTFSEAATIEEYDWRLQALTTTTADATVGGKVFKAGTVVMAIAEVPYDWKTVHRFALPSTPALMLDFAKQMYDDACTLATKLGRTNPISLPEADKFPLVFEMLEKRMAAVLFSFTALEAFANETIARAYGEGYTFNELDPSGTATPRPLEYVERRTKLEEKLNSILPQIFSLSSPKGKYQWQNFKRLQKIRDRITHNKQVDRVPSKAKDETLWRYLTDSDFKNYPAHAKDIIDYFWQTIDGDCTARWYEKMPW